MIGQHIQQQGAQSTRNGGILQGLALGGEYGGAAVYVAEHAPQGQRGYYTAFIQTTATLGLFLSLMVILATRTAIGEEAFADWGWRVPFLVSVFLLGISVWIRLSMNESPAFQKMKEEGKVSKAPLSEAFGQWKNLKVVILALVGLTAGQAVVWYTGQFYALFFLTQTLKVDGATANILIAASLLIGTPFFIVFGSLSDKIGRKNIIMAGCVIAAATFFPIFKGLTHFANPALEAAAPASDSAAAAAAATAPDPADTTTPSALDSAAETPTPPELAAVIAASVTARSPVLLPPATGVSSTIGGFGSCTVSVGAHCRRDWRKTVLPVLLYRMVIQQPTRTGPCTAC